MIGDVEQHNVSGQELSRLLKCACTVDPLLLSLISEELPCIAPNPRMMSDTWNRARIESELGVKPC